MMTFIAYYGLNELLGQHPGLNCGELLDKLHVHVKKHGRTRQGQPVQRWL